MCTPNGTKFSSMKDARPASAYDSSSSRWQAPQAGAALKSINIGLFCSLAWLNAWSASLIQFTDIMFTSVFVEVGNEKYSKATGGVLYARALKRKTNFPITRPLGGDVLRGVSGGPACPQ